ncbi:MAG: carboxypeptidase-like regulatory domain-containing protein [Patescibacteria group bacterium]
MISHARGATLIDTLVGVSLMLLVFVGIAAGFELAIDVVSNNKARIGALALMQEQMEFVRSLPYESMGVSGGIPAGAVPQIETVPLNGVSYTRRTLIRYYDDPNDGLAGADTNGIVADAKEIKVSVSWQAPGGVRTLKLASRASPKGIEQVVIGGTISVSVVNAASLPVAGATVRIVNASTTPAIDITSLTNASGTTAFIGAPQAGGYQVTASLSGYSSAQTYTATAQNPNPNPGHLTVSNNVTTAGTFAIDLLSQKTVHTYKQIETLTWEDLFNDDLKVATTTNATIASGTAHLTGPAPYTGSGEVQSVSLSPSYLYQWDEIQWTDTEPAQTEIRYHVYYLDGADPTPIPDGVLPGNSAGFVTSPVDISGISTTTYPSIRVRASLATTDNNETPTISSWRIVYENGPEPLGNIAFTMTGAKTIGTDGGGSAIYKYDTNSTTDALGVLAFSGLEWDTYTISVDGASIGYDIAESCEPQPRGLTPGVATTTRLYFAPHTTNSVLVDVRTTGGMLVPNASVRMYRVSSGYNTTQTTSGCGQTFFSGLSSGTVAGANPYSIDVTATGYQAYTSTEVDVSGTSRLSIVLTAL